MTTKCMFCGAEEEVDHEITYPVCDRPECLEQAKWWRCEQVVGEWMSRHVEVRQEKGQPTMFRLKDAAAASQERE